MLRVVVVLLSLSLLACQTRPTLEPALVTLPPLEVAVSFEQPASDLSSSTVQTQQQEVEQLCQELGKRLGSVSSQACIEQKLQHSGHYSVQGRALVFKDYPAAQSAAPKVLVVGGIHGDEYSSFSLLFRWLEKLDQGGGEAKQHWRLLPASNPDGLLSRRPAQRMNANGVDLNRNFSTSDWRDKAHNYWQRKTRSDKRRNPGAAASSEPETRWISDLVNQWQPDLIVAVHAPYGILDFDSPPVRSTEQGLQPPQRIGMLHLNLLGTYPGSLGRYAAHDRNVPVLTMELPHAGIMPSPAQQRQLWTDLANWVTKNLVK